MRTFQRDTKHSEFGSTFKLCNTLSKNPHFHSTYLVEVFTIFLDCRNFLKLLGKSQQKNNFFSIFQMGDEKEGPVTKSIRLTSSLILKNLVIYSNLGKK